MLTYDHVEVSYNGRPVVHDVCAQVRPGQVLGIVGESGSGKSTLVRAAMGLLGVRGAVTRGRILYQGEDLVDVADVRLQQLRGAEIGMVFQDCLAALTPIRTVGEQLFEAVAVHSHMTDADRCGSRRRGHLQGEPNGGLFMSGEQGRGGILASNEQSKFSRSEVEARACDLLARMNVADPERVLASYPFELSGGLGQRVGIAMAMMLNPKVLLADEPTSALDAVTQKQVVEELAALRDATNTAIVVVTHNIGVVRKLADEVLVLKDGIAVEQGPATQVLNAPTSDYTRDLLAAVPTLGKGE